MKLVIRGVTYDTFLFKKDGRIKPAYRTVVEDSDSHFNGLLDQLIGFVENRESDDW